MKRTFSSVVHRQAPSVTNLRAELDRLVLPQLYCPFTSQISPHAEAVDRQMVEWARQFHLLPVEAAYQRMCAARLGWLAARTHYDAPRAELQLVADWCAWLFIRDDYCDDTGLGKQPTMLASMHTHFLELLNGVDIRPETGPLTEGFRDLVARTTQRTDDAWVQRFSRNLQDFFDAGVWEANNRADSIMPDVTTYVNMRPYTGGLFCYIDLFDISDGIQLPSHVRQHPVVQQLTLLANNVVCWANDIMSLAKEVKHGDVHNLVLALWHKHQLDLQAAVYRAAALHDANVRAFIDLELRLPALAPAVESELRRYIALLRSFMRGSLDWLYTSGRYLLAAQVGGG